MRGPDGAPLRYARRVALPTDGELVAFTQTFESPAWPEPLVSQSTLRFFDASTVAAFVADSGLLLERQLGDWDGRPLRPEDPEIITIARRSRRGT